MNSTVCKYTNIKKQGIQKIILSMVELFDHVKQYPHQILFWRILFPVYLLGFLKKIKKKDLKKGKKNKRERGEKYVTLKNIFQTLISSHSFQKER